MTTRVNIENPDTNQHDVEVYTVSVDNLAGKRNVRSEHRHITLKPGGITTVYIHECQDLKIVEKRQ